MLMNSYEFTVLPLRLECAAKFSLWLFLVTLSQGQTFLITGLIQIWSK